MKRRGKTIALSTVAVGMMVLVWAGIAWVKGKSTKPTATREGHTITLRPLDATFQIPQGWLDWHAKYHNNLHLNRAELENVRFGEGQWDKEYAEVVNAIFPFEDCVAHLGGFGWGNGAGLGDVQMRVYVVEMNPERVQQKTANAGALTASTFSKRVSVKRSEYGKWHRVILSYSLWYGDYGGVANVDVFAQAFWGRTVVLAFMYSDSSGGEADDVPEIVRSLVMLASQCQHL